MKHGFLMQCMLCAAFVASTAVGLAQTPEPPPNDTFAPDVPTATPYATQSVPMTLVLDARAAPRGLMYSHMTIPVRAGLFTFVYPEWIPGEHSADGPLNNVSQIHVSAGGHSLAWHRDVVDMYAFHVDVPPGVSSIDVDFTVLANGAGTMTTPHVAVVNWNRVMFYQTNVNSHDYYVKPSIILPKGWGYATALYGAKQSGGRVDFDVTPLNRFIDSPLDAGQYYKHVLLWQNGNATQWLDIFADKPQDLDISPKVLDAYKRMPNQAFALYGSRHWTWYHSMLTLSDAIGFEGIEHHQSSDDRAPDDFMTNPHQQLLGGDLVTHELSHSWNGKYRRPWDLTTLNFQIPQRTDLLWVYEGMNQYLGDLLSFRSGIRDPKDYPEYLASIWARMDTEPGRYTTPLIDTTTGAPYYYTEGRGPYSSLRRTAGDFYTEGELIWLDADTIIRQQTGGKASLDTFLHKYSEPAVTGPITKTYTREEIESLLNSVAPYDWHGFFERYVYQVSQHPPEDDLARAGWRLVYTDKPNKFAAGRGRNPGVNDWYSVGLTVDGNGTVGDVRENSPAWNAGLAPGMKVLAVAEQPWSTDAMQYAIKQAAHTRSDIVLRAQNGSAVGTYSIAYHDGLRYPHLVRIPGVPDMLAKIMAPH
jgi:predicted metalloprotease with PDZ domain